MNAPRRIIAPQLVAERHKYKLRVDDYLLLDRAKVFEGSETELIDGDVIVMSPEWMPHMRIKDELAYRLRRAIETIGLDLRIGTGGSVAFSNTDMPRPDVIVMHPVNSDTAVPGEAVLLCIEVSSTTLPFDLGEKALSYAAYALPEYWVADVNGRVIHQHWSPGIEGYRERRTVAFGEPVTAATVADLTIDTSGL